jgi:hypothetical protein
MSRLFSSRNFSPQPAHPCWPLCAGPRRRATAVRAAVVPGGADAAKQCLAGLSLWSSACVGVGGPRESALTAGYGLRVDAGVLASYLREACGAHAVSAMHSAASVTSRS